MTFTQRGVSVDATLTYANGTKYAAARLEWNPALSAFAGTGTIAITCGTTTADTQFKAQFVVVNETTVRERFSNPQKVDCRTGQATSYSSEELVWTVRDNK